EKNIFRALVTSYKGLFGADMPLPTLEEMRHTRLRHADNPGAEETTPGYVSGHLAETRDYINRALDESIALGDTRAGRMKFGIALHGIQDLPSHTNMLELYLSRIDPRVQTFTR